MYKMNEPFVIELQSVDVFQRENLVLSGVNLEIKQGEFVFLIGQTGSGKSSLLKLIYGDLHLTDGKGHVAGFDLSALKSHEIPMLRRKLGIVFQDFQLLIDRSVAENLLFVLKATGWTDKIEIYHKIEEVLLQVGLEGKGHKMPHELSGGEQQRVVIARALLNNPDIILADEPTGNLDPVSSTDIMNLLLEISSKGTAVLMATHDYHMIEKFPSRIIKCENGKVYEEQNFVLR